MGTLNKRKMATVRYSLKGTKKNPMRLYLRFSNTRAIDLWTPVNIFLNPEHWDQKNQKIRNVITVKNRDAVNKKLNLLTIHLIDTFNADYMEGEIIDSVWLREAVNLFFSRPKTEVKGYNKPHTIYYTDFAKYWIDEKSKDWLIGTNKFMSQREKSKYTAFNELVKEFEGSNRVKFKAITNKTITAFVAHLSENNYASQTIKRHVGRFKFFCLRAKEENIVIDNSYAQRIYIPEAEEIKEPFLNPKEIEAIFKHDFSDSDKLDNVRDNLIIAVWTGLRISDFMKGLNIDNFIDDFIEITNQKTGAKVSIPVHPNIKKILIKRNGQLPRKISDAKFNEYVKIVCKKVGLKEKMKGRLYDKGKERKITDFYEKYKLVSSHIGRRSMATNHFGKIPNQTLMKICGWTSENMMLKYIKKSDRSYAIELKKYWETVY